MNRATVSSLIFGASLLGATSSFAYGFNDDDIYTDSSANTPQSYNATYAANGAKFFYKKGQLYMEKDGKLYIYVKTKSVLPSDPFQARASMPVTGPANLKGTFVFDPKKLSWAAYDASGRLVKSGAASGGQSYCYDTGRSCHTPSGTYAVFSKGSVNCKSNTYPLNEGGGAPMPYCMFFSGGFAIHGAYDVPNYNASHGCVRVHPTAAAWLSSNFIQYGTKVIILPY